MGTRIHNDLRKKQLPFKILLLVIALLSMWIVLLQTSTHGVGISEDSAAYISAARSLQTGKGFVDNRGSPYKTYPPLFPAILAVFGIDPLLSVRYINSIAFAIIACISYNWIFKKTNSLIIALFCALAIITSVSLTKESRNALSEPIFIAFSIASIIAIHDFLENGRFRYYVFSVLLAAAAWISRYVGVAVVLTIMLCIFFQMRSVRKKIIYSATYGFVAFIPVALWMLRNFYITGKFAGNLAPPKYTLFQNLLIAAGNMYLWISPVLSPNLPSFLNKFVPPSKSLTLQKMLLPMTLDLPKPLLLIILLVSLAFMVIIAYLVFKVLKDKNNIIKRFDFVPFSLFIIIYLCTILWATARYGFLEDRYLCPIVVPMFIIISLLISTAHAYYPASRFSQATLIIAFLWLIYPLNMTNKTIHESITEGFPNYNTREWTESQLIPYIKNIKGNVTVYTQFPLIIYLKTGKLTRIIPELPSTCNLSEADRQQYLIKWREQALKEGRVMVAFFKIFDPKKHFYSMAFFDMNYYREQDFARLPNAEKIASFPDGVMFEIK